MEVKPRSKDTLVIGIDPDSVKSGIGAFYHSKLTACEALAFPDLEKKLKALMNVYKYEEVEIYVEAGWLNSGNWHLSKAKSKAMAAAIGQNTGACHQTGKLIIEWCRKNFPEAQVYEVKPFRKYWKGKDGKITAEELEQQIGQPLPKRTNQEMRDAVLIAWCKQ